MCVLTSIKLYFRFSLVNVHFCFLLSLYYGFHVASILVLSDVELAGDIFIKKNN